ncbi:MAG: hypothetical protein ACD_45C00071G0002 [uncultured bacterium]|nr:MAG: hypothetical protein ACD_45C00071G0002 [uncultured bacterium]OGT55255.1 MAG: dihydroorotate dehydrogenase (quinone) [Gammaproteobacteria bacterium RIFCSPHIGHO2_12_FULL_42_10]
MLYQLLKTCLFMLPPETAHHVTLQSLKIAHQLKLIKPFDNATETACTLMGLTFPNKIGLAAGLDKDAHYVDALSSLGFGYLEIGSITPKAQYGNPKPRLFRLTQHEALINRMGFNNEGALAAVERLKKINYRGILGISITKNKETPLEDSAEDYLFCMRHLWPFASYFAINISSPNTPGLRSLQQENYLQNLLRILKQEQKTIHDTHHLLIPLVVKISPDLSWDALHSLAVILLEQKVEGVIATNTTLARDAIKDERHHTEDGGLSGKPLQAQSTQVIRRLHTVLQDKIPIIGCGGISDIASAREKLEAGASLLQLYTGLIYHGPQLIRELVKTC